MHRLFLLALSLLPAFAQRYDLDEYIRLLNVAPGATVSDKMKSLDSLGITLSDRGLRQLSNVTADSPSPAYHPRISTYAAPAVGSPQVRSTDSQRNKLGNLNSDPYDPDSVSNPYGQYGSPYSPKSINNPYGVYGSPYSPYSATNPYATQAPTIVAPNGNYLGKFSSNPYDPDSTSNPYGQYGSPYSPNSINNPYGIYGSPYSPNSVRNPYSTGKPTPNLPRLPTLRSFPTVPNY